MRGRSPAALRTVSLISTAAAVARGWVALSSAAAAAEQVRQADRSGSSIEFSPVLWTGQIGGSLVAAAAVALAIFACVGLRPRAEQRAGSPAIAAPMAGAVASVVVGLVAGPYVFPLFVVAAAVLVLIAARRYWARPSRVSPRTR